MKDFKTILEFRNYIQHDCSEHLKEKILDIESEKKEVSTFLLTKGIDEKLCNTIQIGYSNQEDNINMYNILKAVGFNTEEITDLMRKMKLSMPAGDIINGGNGSSDSGGVSNILTINYDEAWRKKIFSRYFNEDESEINNSLDKIVALAGEVFAAKVILDIIVDYYLPTQEYVDRSVWGITEEIINRYKKMSFLENENTETLSGKIGNAIMNYVDKNH